MGSRVGQVVARLKATFSCASGRTDPYAYSQQPSRYDHYFNSLFFFNL